MLELLAEICLAGQPATCVTRLLPSPDACSESTIDDWLAARPGLVAADVRCGPLSEAMEAIPVTEIAPGVFVHRGRHELLDPDNAGDQANIGFIVGRDAVAVVDAGGSRAVGEALYAAIRARTDLPIRWLVLTHMHPDHVFGASVFREAGATVLGHARLPVALANREASYRAGLEREADARVAIGSDIVMPNATVAGTRTIDLGGRILEIEAHQTAHTDNDLTVLDRATGTWWVGDLVFHEHTPVVDGSALGWLALLDRLAARPAARIVPGHGSASLPWPEGSTPTHAYLAALVAETRDALADGESLGEATRHVGETLRGDWLLFDAFNGRNATAVYRELEWE